MIPSIIKYNINMNTKNMINNFINNPSYFIYPNKFNLNFVKIGPFKRGLYLTITIYDFQAKIINFPNKKVKVDKIDEYDRSCYYYKLVVIELIIKTCRNY